MLPATAPFPGRSLQTAVSFAPAAAVRVWLRVAFATACVNGSVTMALVEIVELKWLLAGEGVHVHVERLQTDPEYARRILDMAASSRNPALRAAADRVRHGLARDAA